MKDNQTDIDKQTDRKTTDKRTIDRQKERSDIQTDW